MQWRLFKDAHLGHKQRVVAFCNRIPVEEDPPVLMLRVHPVQPALKEHPLLATGGMAL